jgi:hypothetical protein
MSTTVATLQVSTVATTDDNATTQWFPLTEPTSPFHLWSIALISLSVLVVTNMVFVMTILLCRILKERTKKSSAYSIRPQQGLYLPNQHYYMIFNGQIVFSMQF